MHYANACNGCLMCYFLILFINVSSVSSRASMKLLRWMGEWVTRLSAEGIKDKVKRPEESPTRSQPPPCKASWDIFWPNIYSYLWPPGAARAASHIFVRCQIQPQLFNAYIVPSDEDQAGSSKAGSDLIHTAHAIQPPPCLGMRNCQICDQRVFKRAL